MSDAADTEELAPGQQRSMHPRAGIVTTNRAVFQDMRDTLGRLGLAQAMHMSPQQILDAPRSLLWIIDVRLPGGLKLIKQLLGAGHVHGMALAGPTDLDVIRHLCRLGLPALMLHREVEPPPDDDPTLPLTRREIQVLALVARGLTNAQVAGELVLSPATVKSHLARMFQRTGARDRANLVLLAMRAGIIN